MTVKSIIFICDALKHLFSLVNRTHCGYVIIFLEVNILALFNYLSLQKVLLWAFLCMCCVPIKMCSRILQLPEWFGAPEWLTQLSVCLSAAQLMIPAFWNQSPQMESPTWSPSALSNLSQPLPLHQALHPAPKWARCSAERGACFSFCSFPCSSFLSLK